MPLFHVDAIDMNALLVATRLKLNCSSYCEMYICVRTRLGPDTTAKVPSSKVLNF